MLGMNRSPRKKRSAATPGSRALEACGDGFWELDLNVGSAWYSAWFYQKLGWPAETKRTTLEDLKPHLKPEGWTLLMTRIREQLEEGRALDFDFEAAVPGAGFEWWHIRGSALRNAAGRPEYLAGSVRELAPDRNAGGAFADLRSVQGAFEALPVAAAILDARAALLRANRQWNELPAATTAQAMARLKAANSQTAIEFWLDQGEGFDAGPRRLRVRAIAFQHEGARHLAVTLEDRRSD
jgi:hypothetical protein